MLKIGATHVCIKRDIHFMQLVKVLGGRHVLTEESGLGIVTGESVRVGKREM